MTMGDRQRYQSQYDQDRGRRDQRDDNREQRLQPREWQPSEDYRRDEQREPRDRYANYYNDRQFGTRGRDEREQGARYGTEEEWRPWPNDSGYARSEFGSRDERQRRTQSQSQYGNRERSYSSSYSPRSYDDNAGHLVDSYGSYSPSEYRSSAERQQQTQREWGRTRYPADNDYYANQPREEHHESFGHQLREAGQKIARSVKRAFRGPKGYKRSDDRIREDVSDRLGENPYIDCSEVEVTVNNGEVTLTGVVTSRQEKFLIEEITDDVSGVNEVHNQVRVKREQQGNPAMAETVPGNQTSAEIAARSRNARA
jgi:osmotically-inducible protein OsmY